MKFLDSKEAEKFKKQKWKQFCWTPCIKIDNKLQNGVPVWELKGGKARLFYSGKNCLRQKIDHFKIFHRLSMVCWKQ